MTSRPVVSVETERNMDRSIVRGCLVSALAFGLTCAGKAQVNTDAPAGPPQQQPATPLSQPAPVSPPFPHSDRLQVNCESPKDHDEADLCEQKRQAQAAEDTVAWAAFQTKWTIAGIIAALASLFLSAWAAIAASRAAQSAAAGVELSKKYFIADRRPWIEVVNLEMHSDLAVHADGRFDAAFTILVGNRGNSPAERLHLRLSVYDDPIKAMNFAKSVTALESLIETTSQAVFPGREDRSRMGWAGNFDGTPQPALGTTVYIAGGVFYSFSAGREHYKTPFVYRLQRVDAKPLRDFERNYRADLIAICDYSPPPT